MGIELEQLSLKLENVSIRLDKLENSKDQEIITLVEVLANITFFGQLKKNLCQHAKDGQCSFYVVETPLKTHIPFTASCRIKDCEEHSNHSHIDISNITCGLCYEASEIELFHSNSKQELTFKQSRIDKLWQEEL
jgi:hypothetical protein